MRKRFRVFQALDGPIAGVPMLTHARLSYGHSVAVGERLVVTDAIRTNRRHEVIVVDSQALTVKWLADAGPITLPPDRSVSVGWKG